MARRSGPSRHSPYARQTASEPKRRAQRVNPGREGGGAREAPALRCAGGVWAPPAVAGEEGAAEGEDGGVDALHARVVEGEALGPVPPLAVRAADGQRAEAPGPAQD